MKVGELGKGDIFSESFPHKIKSCPRDLVPATVFKQCIPVLLLARTMVVNHSAVIPLLNTKLKKLLLMLQIFDRFYIVCVLISFRSQGRS